MTDVTLTIPGLVFIGAEGAGKDAAVVQIGSAVGWTIPKGVHTWSRELSVVVKEDITPDLQKELGVVLPEQQGDPEFVPRARKAAQASKLVAVEQPLSDKLLAKGLRVHTVGFDRVSNGFFYFASGGSGGPKRMQGELIEIISPSLKGEGTREELEARLDGLIDRLIGVLSDGLLTEVQLELAEALPVLGPKSDEAGDKLQTLEGWLILSASRSAKFEADARRLTEALRTATRRETDVVGVPVFGEARRVVQPELEVEITEGEAGKRSRLTLPARTRWLVTNARSPSSPVATAAAPAPVAKPAARATPDQPAAGQAVASHADGERAAAERAAADRAVAERAAAERAATERAAAERAAAERAAAERAAADRAAAQRAMAEAERLADIQRADAERAAVSERAALERAAAEKAAAERRAAKRMAADQAAISRVSSDTASGPTKRIRVAEPKKEPFPVGFVLLMLFVGAIIGAALRFVGR
jgi:hypothetical protein